MKKNKRFFTSYPPSRIWPLSSLSQLLETSGRCVNCVIAGKQPKVFVQLCQLAKQSPKESIQNHKTRVEKLEPCSRGLGAESYVLYCVQECYQLFLVPKGITVITYAESLCNYIVEEIKNVNRRTQRQIGNKLIPTDGQCFGRQLRNIPN